MTTAWGVLPESVRARLRQLEWTNVRHLRERLLGNRPFPIRLGLKPPTGRQALVFEPLCDVDRALYLCLVRNLTSLEVLGTEDSNKLASTLRQLRPGLCRGNHLRGLPLSGLIPTHLVSSEVDLYRNLLERRYGGSCLEQERISADWIRRVLDQWHEGAPVG